MPRNDGSCSIGAGGSFIALAWTGFALKFPDSWIAHTSARAKICRRWSHRVAGLRVVMLLAGAYHLGYINSASREGGGCSGICCPHCRMRATRPPTHARGWPAWAASNLQFVALRLRGEMEYWAVVWARSSWSDRAESVQMSDALSAALVVEGDDDSLLRGDPWLAWRPLVWHFYHVIFDPDVYPLNRASWMAGSRGELAGRGTSAGSGAAGGKPDGPARGSFAARSARQEQQNIEERNRAQL